MTMIKTVFATMLTVTLLLLVGCGSTQYASPLVTEYEPGDVEQEMSFWHELADQPIVTNNDAFHALIELADGQDPFDSYDQRVQWLTDHGLLDAGFDAPPDQAVRRGTVAQIVARILEIEGGLTMRLIGAHPRYATRELVYLEIMKPGTQFQALSGIQFVGIVARAENFEGQVP
jgi:hypothetical protein